MTPKTICLGLPDERHGSRRTEFYYDNRATERFLWSLRHECAKLEIYESLDVAKRCSNTSLWAIAQATLSLKATNYAATMSRIFGSR